MKFIFDIETTGLEAMTDRILCITIMNVETQNIVTFYGEDEKLILQQFFSAIQNCEELISFNGDFFDRVFLIQRSLILNVKMCERINEIKHIDLRKIAIGFSISYNRYAHGKLRDWASILLIDVNTEDGSMMKTYYEKKDWKSIREHCEEDCKIIYALYNRIKYIGLLE